jgi:hypothetical protein
MVPSSTALKELNITLLSPFRTLGQGVSLNPRFAPGIIYIKPPLWLINYKLSKLE